MPPHRPLRVCHLAYSFYENDNRVVRYAETLAARGDAVHVISLRRPGQEWLGEHNRVSIRRIQRRSRGERAPWVFLLKILWFAVKAFAFLGVASLRERYDVVHVHNVPDFLVFSAAVPKVLGTRVILDLHDLLPEFYAGKFGARQNGLLYRTLLATERLSCRFADHVIVANHLWHERVRQRSIRSGGCTPILNYPAPEFFRQTRVDARLAEGAPFVFLYPGTLNHHQGLDLAIDAFAEASGKMPRAELRIYGDGPARGELRERAAAAGVGDRVIIEPFVPFHQVPALMASADVGVVPKRADGFGNEAFSTKILEFMAGGVPVIVSRTKVDAYYFDESAVRFFAPGDAHDLARQMLWAYEHPAERRAMAAEAARYAAACSWERHAAEYLAIVDGTESGEAVHSSEPAARHSASR